MALSGLCTPDCTVGHFSIYYAWSKNCSIKCHSSSNLECKDLQEGAYLTLVSLLWHFKKHLYGYFLLLLSPECFMFLEMRFKNFSPIKNVFLENRKLLTDLAMLQRFELTFFNINDYISNSRLFVSNKGFRSLFIHMFYFCTEFLIWFFFHFFFFSNKNLINNRFFKSSVRRFILSKISYEQRTVNFIMFSLVGKIFWISDDVFLSFTDKTN